MRVLTNRHYGGVFNVPRNSRHDIVRARFPGYARAIWRPLEAIALWNPLNRYDLIHTFNKIPLVTSVPWIVTFESILPRTIGPAEQRLRTPLRRRLVSEDCQQVIAISDYAQRTFESQNADWQALPEVLSKLQVVYPNVELRADRAHVYGGGRLDLVFVGNDFARKGGIVALRIAQKALDRGLPVHVHIVSAMQYGASVYTDAPDAHRYAEDLSRIHLPNVTMHGTLSNQRVLELMKTAHLHLLPTIDDTFGYSVLESFSVGRPAIVSGVCALPELVETGVSGCVVPLPLDARGKWTHLRDRDSQSYWGHLTAAYEHLAAESIAWLEGLIADPGHYELLSHGAIQRIRQHHDARVVGVRLDDLYEAAAHRTLRTSPDGA